MSSMSKSRIKVRLSAEFFRIFSKIARYFPNNCILEPVFPEIRKLDNCYVRVCKGLVSKVRLSAGIFQDIFLKLPDIFLIFAYWRLVFQEIRKLDNCYVRVCKGLASKRG
ncbi:hypothetical protein CEXT_100021 [Caerostris extrusa]|uniref:Uncharacterized protein n=1 Tax=Caerostris extrusa TaxID=172846 RepID=A0AAV4XHF0_CAEEX|nr:hypothetical protein CEXT_100021 [Caerostris extrusa]